MIEDLFQEKYGKSRDFYFPALQIPAVSTSSPPPPQDSEQKKKDLDAKLCYLDHAGAPLVCHTLLQDVFEDLRKLSLGNPHSAPASSSSSGAHPSGTSHHIMDQARHMILKHVHCNTEEYQVIFTSNATASLKMVGEMFPFGSTGEFWYCPQVHTSVLGIRAYVQSSFHHEESIEDNRRWRCFVEKDLYPAFPADQELFADQLPTCLNGHTLLALPGECNFSGAKFNFEALDAILSRYKKSEGMGKDDKRLMWLLDAAKLAGSDEINISSLPSHVRPDFITMSFYKIFGYPTGIGALIIKKEVMPLMQKKYFGGGTLLAGATDTNFSVPRSSMTSEHYEDGTVNYHGIAALRHGFNFISSLGGMTTISNYTNQLLQYAYHAMKDLRHETTQKQLCVIYSPSCILEKRLQGPVITFNLQYANGYPISFHEVQKLGHINNIQLRTGCFCNLGGCQSILHLSGKDNEENFRLGRICSHGDDEHVIPVDVINHKNTGACRISFGYSNTVSDILYFIQFLKSHFLNQLPMAQMAIPLLLPSLSKEQEKNDQLQETNAVAVNDEDYFWHHKVFNFPLLPNYFKPDSSPLNSSLEPTIAALFVYPIKSCAGIRVNNWPVLYSSSQLHSLDTSGSKLSTTGLLYDRYFAIVDETGKVISQKQYPAMALIQPNFILHQDIEESVSSQLLVLQLTAPMMDTILEIPLTATTSGAMQSDIDSEYRVCGRKTFGKKVSHNADEWITSFLNLTSKKSNTNEEDDKESRKKTKSFYVIRASFLEESESNKSSGNISTFANTAQYLLLTMASVKALIQMMKQSNREQSCSTGNQEETLYDPSMNIKVENFRPNIIISRPLNSEQFPHEEDTWTQLQIPVYSAAGLLSSPCHEAMLKLDVTGPCSRCSMVNVNGQSGIMDCRVFEALKGYRKHESSVYFGQFLTYNSHQMLVAPEGGESGSFYVLSVGNPVYVTTR